MSSFRNKPCATRVTFDEDKMCVELTDGRSIIVPLVYFPRLLNSSNSQRKNYIISGGGAGLHWKEIDEDIRVDNLLLGIFDQSSLNRQQHKL